MYECCRDRKALPDREISFEMIVRSVELLESENEHKLNGSLIGEEECAQGDYAHRDIEGVKPYDLKLIRDNLDAGVVSCVYYDD